MKKTRIVKDSMGELEIEAEALYGAQTQRAINNFPISGQPVPREFIEALLLIKLIAAEVNQALGCLEADIAEAIAASCRSLLEDKELMQHFPVDVFQTGSGTSSNMNANEVIATLATRRLEQNVSPNDHVNFGQSSNDVIPTTIHVSATVGIHHGLIPAIEHLIAVTEEKAEEVNGFYKTGRTHLMDAMPVQMSQCLQSWADQLRNNLALLRGVVSGMQMLALGGTAVGTGINTHPEFAARFAAALSDATGVQFAAADNFFPLIGSQDAAVAVSGQLKALAVSLMKIANDLRWMNSGPLAGLGEISLEPLQPGSSIMPGKVNPVIPEATAMAAAQVIGNDAAITVGGQSGNFELNVMLPLIAASLLESIELLSSASRLLADRAIRTFRANEARLREVLAR
ncbi:MAG: class II fumarate hydratase, partial [Thiotrichales bacterium]|nr:class II fumarate hydratase [Thiotrichales bacterium]